MGNNKKKIVIFSGAGISKESGILTFRDVKDGLWNNHKIEDVATPAGWKKNKEVVLNFYNERRQQLPTVQPNAAHIALAELENDYDVTVITQNVDDLHERGGSTNVIHLHGELTKARGSLYNHKPSPADTIVDIGYNDINVGDTCPTTGSQLRPHIVWFGEYPFGVDDAYKAVYDADILLIIGTSLQITYTLDLLNNVRRLSFEVNDNKPACKIIYIDPMPDRGLDRYGLVIDYIKKTAVEGVTELVDKLLNRDTVTYRPLPSYLTIKDSLIDGKGLFATADIDGDFVIGVTHVADARFPDGYIRTPLGGFFNHSTNPNCEVISENDFIKLKTIKNIKAGEELTATYTLYKPKA